MGGEGRGSGGRGLGGGVSSTRPAALAHPQVAGRWARRLLVHGTGAPQARCGSGNGPAGGRVRPCLDAAVDS